jgi:hypothetical protein
MSARKIVHCVGSPSFQPQEAIKDTACQDEARQCLAKDDLLAASRVLFSLPDPDEYVYHAMTSVKLAEVQRIVTLGGINGLHGWYRAEDGSPVRRTLSSFYCR